MVWPVRVSCATQGQELVLHLESLVADGLEEGALTWFPQISPHEQRHRHRCAMNNLASAGGLEEGNKLSLAGLFKVSSQKQ